MKGQEGAEARPTRASAARAMMATAAETPLQAPTLHGSAAPDAPEAAAAPAAAGVHRR